MKHVVIARDGTDDDAKARRAAARLEHLRRIAPRVERGEILIGGAILDEAGDMVGSVLLVDFETRDELDAWLEADPYVTGRGLEGHRGATIPARCGRVAPSRLTVRRIRPDC